LSSTTDNHGSNSKYARGDHTHFFDKNALPVVPPAYQDQTVPITLDPSRDNSGTVEPYARGNHTHYLDLSEIEIDLKTPVKIFDETGKIKKVLIEKTIPVSYGEWIQFYIKLPFTASQLETTASVSIINLSITYRDALDSVFKTSYFKISVQNTYGSGYGIPTTIKANINTTNNNAMIYFQTKSIVYCTVESKIYYYLKLKVIDDYSSETVFDVTYADISSNSAIPEELTYDSMIVTTLPATESTYDKQNVVVSTSFLDAVMHNPNRLFVLTNSTINPGTTHNYLYPDTDNNWTAGPTIVSGIYAWKYSGSV
jgi:hypothetical protein